MFAGSGCAVVATSLANCCGEETAASLARIFSGDSGVSVLSEGTLRDSLCVSSSSLGGVYVGQVPRALPADHSHPRQQRVAEQALGQIAEPLRRAVERYGSARVALVLGTSTGGIQQTELASQQWRADGTLPAGYDLESQHLFDGLLREVTAKFAITGPAYVISTACSSSAKALASAARLLKAGIADAVLTGGVDSLCLTTILGFSSLGVLAQEVSQPFGARRAGMNVAEGAAFLLLERSFDASVFLLAAGETSDAYHMTHPHPDGQGAEAAMRQALAGAKVSPSRVDYVNAHGTGTQANDAAEALALRRLFDGRTSVSSTKGLTGHQLGAAGATEAVITCAAIERGVVPGNRTPADLRFGLNLDPNQQRRRVELALSNSLAFGGSNASLLFAHRRAHDQLMEGLLPPLLAQPLNCEVVAADVIEGTYLPSAAAQALLGVRGYGRASPLCRLFAELFVRSSALRASEQSAVVFGSAYGEMTIAQELLRLQSECPPNSSPLKFQASVHNSAAGQISIASGHSGFSTAIAAGNATTAMALVEAISILFSTAESEVLVLLADEQAPLPFSKRDHGPLGAGLLLRKSLANSEAQHRLRLYSSSEPPAIHFEEQLWTRNPVTDACTLVRAFQNRSSKPVTLRVGGAALGAPLCLSYYPPASHDLP